MSLEDRLEAFRQRQKGGSSRPAGTRPALLTWEGRLAPGRPLRPRRRYLDIETTGFYDGLPVVLIGWAWAEAQDTLHFWQGSPGDLDAEGDLLREALKGGQSVVVTYNGTSFDLPRLRSRAVTWDVTLPDWEHEDLLPTARRLYGHRHIALGLSSIGRSLCGINRPPDLPGEGIAENARLFLETGERAFMDEIAAHNRHDLLALAVLDGRMAADIADAAAGPDLAFGQGRVHLAAGRPEEALAAFSRVPDDSPLSQRAGAMAGRAARLAGRMAADHLARATRPLPAPRAHLELARALERERGDVEGAIAACDAGITALSLLGDMAKGAPLMALLERRRRRLVRLIGRRRS